MLFGKKTLFSLVLFYSFAFILFIEKVLLASFIQGHNHGHGDECEDHVHAHIPVMPMKEEKKELKEDIEANIDDVNVEADADVDELKQPKAQIKENVVQVAHEIGRGTQETITEASTLIFILSP